MGVGPFDSGFGSLGVIGRAKAWGRFTRALGRYAPGVATDSVLVSGVAGSGKTFFLEECGRCAVEAGLVPVRFMFREGRDNVTDFLNAIMAAGAWVHQDVPRLFIEVMKDEFMNVFNLTFPVEVRPETLAFKEDALVGARLTDRQTLAQGLLVSMTYVLRDLGYKGLMLLVDDMHVATPEDIRVLSDLVKPIMGRRYLENAESISVFAGDLTLYGNFVDNSSVSHRMVSADLDYFERDEVGEALGVPAAEYGVVWGEGAVESVWGALGGAPDLTLSVARRIWDDLSPSRGAVIDVVDVRRVLRVFLDELSETLFKRWWDQCNDIERRFLYAVYQVKRADGFADVFDATDFLGIYRDLTHRAEVGLEDKGLLNEGARSRDVGFMVPAFGDYVRVRGGS